MGIIMPHGKVEDDDEFDMVFSMKHLGKFCKQIDKLHFFPVPEPRVHMEMIQVGGECVEQIQPLPKEPNSYRLYSSIYSALGTCSLDKICIMYIDK